MFETTSLILFTTAALALILAPGPSVLYIVARSLEQGRSAGLVSTLGIGLASAVHVGFAALGLSALLMQSALAFAAVKYLGAAYLIYLGIRTLLSKSDAPGVSRPEPMKLGRIFTQGFVVNLLNPKTALFFLAFLPQFVHPERGPVSLQIILLGLIFVTLAILSDGAYALAAGSARRLLRGNMTALKVQKYLAGSVYLALGVGTALLGSTKSK